MSSLTRRSLQAAFIRLSRALASRVARFAALKLMFEFLA